MPIYENLALGNSVSNAKGSISAGDDFLWMGRCGNLSNGKWRLIVDPGTSSGMRCSRSPSLEYGPQNKKASLKKKPFISPYILFFFFKNRHELMIWVVMTMRIPSIVQRIMQMWIRYVKLLIFGKKKKSPHRWNRISI